MATSRGASTRPVSGHSRPTSTIYYPPEVVTSSTYKDEARDINALDSFFSEELALFSFTTPSPTTTTTSPPQTSSYGGGTRTRSVDQQSQYRTSSSSGSGSISGSSSINSLDSYGPPQSVSTTPRPSETFIGYRYQYPPTQRPSSPSFKPTPPSPTPYRSSSSNYRSPSSSSSPHSKPGFNPIHPSSFQGLGLTNSIAISESN